MSTSGNEHATSKPLENEHAASDELESEPEQKIDLVASDSNLDPVKSDAKVALADEKFLLEAKKSSAAIWDSWVKARATTRGEKRSNNLGTFKNAFDAASKKMYKNPVDACMMQLEGMKMDAGSLVPCSDGLPIKPLQVDKLLVVSTIDGAASSGDKFSIVFYSIL